MQVFKAIYVSKKTIVCLKINTSSKKNVLTFKQITRKHVNLHSCVRCFEELYSFKIFNNVKCYENRCDIIFS